MATPAVMEDPQTFLATSRLEPQGPTPCTREQVIHGLASAWRRVAAAGSARRSVSTSSPVPLTPTMSPLAPAVGAGEPMPSFRKGGASPSRLSPTSTSSLSSLSSSSSSGTPTHGTSGKRWQPRWPSFAVTATPRASTVGGDVGPSPLAPHFSNLPASASSPTVRSQHTAKLWSLVAKSITSRRANGTIPFMAPAMPRPPLPSEMSAEAAQHMVYSVQQHHYMCLKHSLLLRMQQDKSADASLTVDCVAQDGFSLHELVRTRVVGVDSAFILVDLSMLVRQFCAWRYNLPLLEPRFALHAQSDPLVLQALTLLGVKVCVSSAADVAALKALAARGYHPLAIDTKPCKTPSLLAATLDAGVRVLTVDGDDEVGRIARRISTMGLSPSALSLVVRLRGPGHKGLSLGSTLELLPSLLSCASGHGLAVHGLSLDVRHFASTEGGAESQLHAALAFCRTAVTLANSLVEPSKLTHVSLLGVDKLMMGAALQALVLLYFPVSSGVSVSIDATSHLADNCTTLVTRIIGKRAAEGGDGSARGFHYYLDDGCYGSLGDVFLHKRKFLPCALSATTGAGELESVHLYPSTLWGPTCDGLDCIDKMTTLPEMDIGDWIYFRNVGSAAFSARTHFNGLTGPKAVHCFTGVGCTTAA